MEGENGARPRPGRGPPAPPPPPGHEEEANGGGGHRRGGQTRQILWPRRLRRLAVALAVMIAAAVYFLFAELALAASPDSAAWFFVAFVLWIVGLNKLYSWMN